MSAVKSQKGRKVTPIEVEIQDKMKIQAEMGKGEVIQSAVTHIWLFRYTNTASLREVLRNRHGGPAMKQPPFNWNSPDKYVEVLNFKMDAIKHTSNKTL